MSEPMTPEERPLWPVMALLFAGIVIPFVVVSVYTPWWGVPVCALPWLVLFHITEDTE